MPPSLPPLVEARVDNMIAAIGRRISEQLDLIMGHRALLETTRFWHSLASIVEHADGDNNIIIEIFACTKSELSEDVRADPGRSVLYKRLCEARSGGATPLTALVLAQSLNGSNDDHELAYLAGALCQRLMTMLIAPIEAPLPDNERWQALRGMSQASNIVLAVDVLKSGMLPSFAIAERMANSFARFRWCANIVGDDAVAGGRIGGSVVEAKPERGVITFVASQQPEAAYIAEAPTLRDPASIEDIARPEDAPFHAALPYQLIALRLAHYLSYILSRDKIGDFLTAITRFGPHPRPYSVFCERPFQRAGVDLDEDNKRFRAWFEPKWCVNGFRPLLRVYGCWA